RCTFVCFSFTGPASTEISTLSLHDALPISRFATGALARRAHTNLHVHSRRRSRRARPLDVDASTGCAAMTPTSRTLAAVASHPRSEEHTSELQSRRDLVCRLLLEKKKTNIKPANSNDNNTHDYSRQTGLPERINNTPTTTKTHRPYRRHLSSSARHTRTL